MRFSVSGLGAGITAARDALDSVSETLKDVAITKLAVPASNAVLLEALGEAAASGERLATLAATSAVAPTLTLGTFRES